MSGRRSHEFYDEVNTAGYGLSKVFSGIDARGRILSVPARSNAADPQSLQLFTSSVTVFPSFSTTVCLIVLHSLFCCAVTGPD